MTNLPPWFRGSGGPDYHPDPVLAGQKMRLPFLDRTLRAVADLVDDFLFAEIHSRKAGLLQKIDPRIKLVTLLLYVVAISLLHSLPWILALYGVSLALAFLSQIPFWFFLRADHPPCRPCSCGQGTLQRVPGACGFEIAFPVKKATLKIP